MRRCTILHSSTLVVSCGYQAITLISPQGRGIQCVACGDAPLWQQGGIGAVEGLGLRVRGAVQRSRVVCRGLADPPAALFLGLARSCMKSELEVIALFRSVIPLFTSYPTELTFAGGLRVKGCPYGAQLRGVAGTGYLRRKREKS